MTHTLSKFCQKPMQKTQIFSNKASFERSLVLSEVVLVFLMSAILFIKQQVPAKDYTQSRPYSLYLSIKRAIQHKCFSLNILGVHDWIFVLWLLGRKAI